MNIVNLAKEENKYLFIWDKHGSVATFMNYKAQLAPLHNEVIKAGLDRQTNADVAEFIRKQFIYSIREGDNLCLDIDGTTPDFSQINTDGTFDANLFFNW